MARTSERIGLSVLYRHGHRQEEPCMWGHTAVPFFSCKKERRLEIHRTFSRAGHSTGLPHEPALGLQT